MDLKALCDYTKHKCTRSRYRDYNFCFKHILEDDSAPFIKCQHISKVTQRRCQNPAQRPERNSGVNLAYCDHHKYLKNQSSKRKIKNRKHLFAKSQQSQTKLQKQAVKALQKYSSSDLIQFENDDSSMEDWPTQSNEKWNVNKSTAWNSGEPDMDLEMTDENENLLQKAGTFTLEEVVSLSRDNLVQLQSLYIDQFKQLQRQLIEGRQKYLTTLQSCGSASVTFNPSEEIRALTSFRRCLGEEKLLANQYQKKRKALSKGEPSVVKPETLNSKTRCSHASNHVRCKSSCLPYTKYCVHHILDDPLQVLYKKCSICNSPVCLLTQPQVKTKTFPEVFCDLHIDLTQLGTSIEDHLKEVESLSDNLVSQQNAKKEVEIKTEPNSDVEIIEIEEESRFDNFEQNFSLPKDIFEASPTIPNVDNHEKPTAMECEDRMPENTKPDNSLSTSTGIPPMCNLNDLQHSQYFVMNEVTESECALHLQPLTGITASGEAEVGESLRIKTSLPTPEKQQTRSQNTDSKQVVSLELNVNENENKNTSNVAKVEHNGAVISVSREKQEKDEKLTKTSAHTVVPPLEGDALMTDDVSQPNISGMPPLAPLSSVRGQSEGQGEEKIDEKNNSLSKNKTDNLEQGEDKLDSNKLEICEKPRKPDPDEADAVVSLLSLSTACPSSSD